MISNMKAAKLLGWTSLAVGVTEIVAAGWLQEQMGVEDHKTLIRLYGVRELGAGAAILREPGITGKLAASLWARVAGDALDIATLCAAATQTRRRNGLITVVAIILAITGLDILIATLVQRDLQHGTAIAEAARGRVTPTQAIPSVTPPEVTPIDTQIPVSIGDN